MKILVAPGIGSSIHSFGNMGDVAMLQACLGRLATVWPGATLSVLTDWPTVLGRFCPEATPIQAVGRNLWLGEDLLLGRFGRFVPRNVKRCAAEAKRTAALRFPGILRGLLATGLRLKNQGNKVAAVRSFSNTLGASDLVVACGAGGFYDGGREWNMECLDVIEGAIKRGIPAVMFGQHFGPLRDPEVLSRAKRILPSVAMITLRGNPVARALLESVGVPGSRIRVTGDEAIELAYKLRPPVPGSGLGINFRLRTSAETSDQDLEKVRPVLHAFAREHGVPLIPVPIAVDPSTSDHRAVMQLLQGFDDGSDGGANLTSPRHVIEQVGRCRALVTCAYHAAVFALAQGIPVVGLVRSRYFAEKLRGLESQFGLGCQILDLEEPDLPGKLKEAIETAWRCAENSRLPLQQAAVRQIEAIWSTYYATRSLFPPR